jgi:hypothetical protein
MAKSEAADVRNLRKYASQVQRLASALSDDAEFARRLIEAVHTGSSAAVEKIFSGVDVDSDVRISTVDGTEAGIAGVGPKPAMPKTRAKATAQSKTRTITVTIGIGPFSISVTVKKESKS